jgi:LPS export ABC transporter protein LptC
MKKNNWIYIIIALIIIGATYMLFSDSSSNKDSATGSNSKTVEKKKSIVYGGTIKEEDGGRLVWKIILDKMQMDNILGTAEAEGVQAELTRSDGSSIHIFGDRAHVDIVHKDVTLMGNVRAKMSTGETLTSDELSWKRKAQEITATGNAILKQGNLTARADKIVSDQKVVNIKLIGHAQVDRGVFENEK